MSLWPRARYLLLACLSLLSPISWAQNQPSQSIDSRGVTMPYDVEVIVVGAGFAGLAAADQLQKQGRSVLLLEARDRIGGRAHTVYAGEQAIEMGANWLHGQDNNPLIDLVKAQDGSLSPATGWGSTIVYDEFGEEIEDAGALLERWQAVVENYVEQYLEREPNASVQMLMDDAQKPGDLGFVSDELHSNFINFIFEQDWSADAADLSVQATEDGEDYLGGDPVPLKGFQPLLKQLAGKIDIQLGHQVLAIQQSAEGVEVTLRHQGQDKTLRAKRVLLTVPISVLQSGKIAFSPQLSARKREAIDVLGMGQLNKVWLKFPEPFWDDNHAMLRVSPEKGRFSLWVNMHALSGQPYLMALSTANHLEAGSDAEIVEEAMLGLRSVYGDDIPEPSKSYISRWQNDPFSMGAYSYLRQGGRPEHRDILAEREGFIYFAGEASHSDFPATVHGAYLSGLREATKIHADLGPLPGDNKPVVLDKATVSNPEVGEDKI